MTDQATTRTDHFGREPMREIVAAAPLVRTARDLWETTTTAIADRVRDRSHHQPTVATALLQEQRADLAHPRLCSVKANRDRAGDDGPDGSQPRHEQLLRLVRVE